MIMTSETSQGVARLAHGHWGKVTHGHLGARNIDQPPSHFSLPEFMNFQLFGKTMLVVNVKFGLFLGHPLSK